MWPPRLRDGAADEVESRTVVSTGASRALHQARARRREKRFSQLLDASESDKITLA